MTVARIKIMRMGKDRERLGGRISFFGFFSNLVVVCFFCLQMNSKQWCVMVVIWGCFICKTLEFIVCDVFGQRYL